MFDITMLGSGALSPTPERLLASAVLTVGGRSILFDCGEGTQIAMRRDHISPQKIDVIALTHYHGDHIFGLPGLLQTMFQVHRSAPLLITGPGDPSAILKPLVMLAGYLPYEIWFGTVPDDGLRLDGLFDGWPDGSLLRAYPTAHRVPSQCYRFDLPRAGRFMPDKAAELGVPKEMWRMLQHGQPITLDSGETVMPEQVTGSARRGLCMTFSGDTSPCPGLDEAAKEADLLICEATYGDNADEAAALERGHSTYAMAAQTAARAGARRLWMTHFSQSMETPEDYLSNAAAYYPEAECGSDGKNITIRFDN